MFAALKMTAKNTPEDLETVLILLDLERFYPEKLSRDDLYEITLENISTSEDKNSKSASWQFINNLTRYNYHARSAQPREVVTTNPARMGYRERAKRNKELQTSVVHPLDVVASVYLCCDPTARQDLVMHMWGCKFAIPFFFHLQNQKKPSVYIWPLRSLIGQFNSNDGIVEMPLIDMPMKSLAFLRIGNQNDVSKSSLLNNLIGGAEKAHPMFFHRNSEGSKRERSTLTVGMIEIGWFLPTDPTLERLRGPHLFANVRGDCASLQTARTFIGLLASVSIVLSTVEDLNKTIATIQDLLKGGSRVILLLSGKNPDADVIDKFVDENFIDLPDTQFEIITVDGHMLADLLEMIFHNIQKMESETKKETCLSDFTKNLSNLEYNTDEVCPKYVNAFELSSDIVSIVQKTDGMSRKDLLLPLQETFWRQWAQLDRDYCRFDQLDPSEKKKYGSRKYIFSEMSKVRQKQFKYFEKNKLSKPMEIFINSMLSIDAYTRKIFLRKLKLDLDKLSRSQLLPFERQYQKLIDQTKHASEEDRAKINQQLTDIDETRTKLSFGLEHLIREVGQLYEACESQQQDHIDVTKEHISYVELPVIACYLLIDGYPVEILDGEACSVPLLWTDQVFKEFPSVLKKSNVISDEDLDINVQVISVLGIQSSGKSTFLNTIFGLQFAVSAGRCTRGAYLQGIKVNNEAKKVIGANYILAIDTEGLKAAELISEESVKHDNELSTFVIGLADTTVINLMGENATYLQENLPIAVHAFLRMNLVGLHPRCTIVHHNVDKRNKDKLLTQGRILELTLNNLTKKACELEKIPQKLFQDIIEFSISENTDYIPALFEGEQPMAPISIGYSKESESVKKKILGFCCSDKEKGNVNLLYFSNHLKRLWMAIKRDRFVFEFRTTLEVEARQAIDNTYSSILLFFLENIDSYFKEYINMLTARRYEIEVIEKSFKKTLIPLEKACREDLDKFIMKPKRQSPECYKHWRQKYMNKLDETMKQYTDSAILQLHNLNQQLNPSISMHEVERFVQLFSESHLTSTRAVEKYFPEIWKRWIYEQFPQNSEISLANDIIKALEEVCHSHIHLVQPQTIEQNCLRTFKPVKEKHLNRSFYSKSSSESDISELTQKMENIKRSVEREYETSVNSIKLSRLPYTDRIPHQILLRVSNHLSKVLLAEDKSTEFTYQFQIDLMTGTAGSMLNDFKDMTNLDIVHTDLRDKLHELVLKRSQRMTDFTHYVISILFDIIHLKIKPVISIIAQSCCWRSLYKSNLKETVSSKRALLGRCLSDILMQSQDTMLETFIISPRQAVYLYLETIVKKEVRLDRFYSEIEIEIKRHIRKIVFAVKETTQRQLQLGVFLEYVLENAEIDRNLESTVRIGYKKYNDIPISIDSVKRLFDEKLYTIIEKEVISIQKRAYSYDIVSATADALCTKIIGCTEVCPFCREICKFSSDHDGSHECFIHRPVGVAGMHWNNTNILSFESCPQHIIEGHYFRSTQKEWVNFRDFQQIYKHWNISIVSIEEPSSIWKWIFVNKYWILKRTRHMTLPEELPDNWKNITRKEVLRAIEDHFNICNIRETPV